MNVCHVVYLGTATYQEVWELQKTLFKQRLEKKIEDRIIFVEHPHVYTIGKKPGSRAHLIAKQTDLRGLGVTVHEIDRGGDITYHGPGQWVGYPILDLHQHYLDIHRYLRDLEEVIIRTLKDFGISSHRESGLTGVWISKNEKIASIGVKVSRWTTMHGFALNVNTDLSYFNGIVPCGIPDKQVVSMQSLIGRLLNMKEVAERLIYNFSDVFQCIIKK